MADLKIMGIDGETYSLPTSTSTATPMKIKGIDGNYYSLPVSGSSGGGGGAETDPIYTADKPNIALKTDVSTAITDNNTNYYTKSEIDLLPKPDNVTDVSLNLTGSDLKATVTTDSNTYESNTVTLPSGGAGVYYESALLASVEIGTSESNPGFVTNNVSFPDIGAVSSASLNVQCEVTRVGGNSALGVVTIIVTGKDSSFHNVEIFRFNKEIARDITKVAIPLHSKRYDLSAYSGVRYQGFYTGTGTVTLENVTAWVE